VIDRAQIAAALDGASSLELYQLVCLLERMLADPRRIVAVRKLLHHGQLVRCVDARSGELVSMRIAALHDTEATLIDPRGAHQGRRVPYAAIEPPEQVEVINANPDAPSPKPPEATPRKPGRADFKRGDKVAFEDKYLRRQVGVIVRINQLTASIDCASGESWRVGFHLLRHVVDI
jgi:hypothetical protein